jgi:hypothetical protein
LSIFKKSIAKNEIYLKKIQIRLEKYWTNFKSFQGKSDANNGGRKTNVKPKFNSNVIFLEKMIVNCSKKRKKHSKIKF